MGYIYFSVFQSDHQLDDNVKSHKAVKYVLASQGIQFTEVIGVYDGVKELSLRVDANEYDVVKPLTELYNQKSILLVTCDNKATLEYRNGDKEDLGLFHVIDKATAEGLAAYTCNPDTDTYYTCSKLKFSM